MSNMTIDGLQRLQRLVTKYPDAASAIERWIEITASADWDSLKDVRKAFPNADGVKLQTGVVVTVFNIRGNNYRLLTIVAYASKLVRVLDLLTHLEYDKEKWKR